MSFSNSYKRDLLFMSSLLNVDYSDFLALHEFISVYDPNSDKQYHLDLCKIINKNFWFILDKIAKLNHAGYIFEKETHKVMGYVFNDITLTAEQGQILYDLLIYRDNDYFIVD